MLRMKTDQEYPVSYKPHHMLIYIYGRKDSEPYGEVASFYLKETKKFQNVGEMVLMLDEIARSLDCSESRDKSCFAGMETAENSPDNLTECMDQTEQNNIKTLLTYRRTAGVSRSIRANVSEHERKRMETVKTSGASGAFSNPEPKDRSAAKTA